MGFKLIYVFDDLSGGRPDQGLPGVPPGVNVPVFPTHPVAPGGTPPGSPPGVWPQPPVGVWPNPPGGRPDQGLPVPPGVNVPGFPTPPIYIPGEEVPEVPEGKAVLVVYVPGLGHKVIVIDAVKPTHPIGETPEPK